jgi:HlyD family secretion protein
VQWRLDRASGQVGIAFAQQKLSMSDMKRRWAILVATVVLTAAVILTYVRMGSTASTPALVTAAVTRGDVVETVDATGTLQAVTTVQVGTQVSGTIKLLHADFNSNVRRGEVIAELEPSLFQAQVEQARASIVRLQADARRAVVQHEDAQQKLKRARELAQRHLIPATELETAQATARQTEAAVDAAEAQIVQARASLHQAEVNLAHTIITAPIDGTVISRNVDVGQTVAASMQAPTLFVIARDLTKMQVNARVAESDIGRIATGQPATFHVDAYPGLRFSGRVSLVRLDPIVEQNVVSYITTIDVPNPQLRLKPGMTANVAIEIARASNVLRVPNAATRVRPPPEVFTALGQPPPPDPLLADAATEEDDGCSVSAPSSAGAAEVWTLRSGRLEPVAVRLGSADATHTAVLAGDLAEGVEVVTGIQTAATANPASATSPLLPQRRPPIGRGTRGPGAP